MRLYEQKTISACEVYVVFENENSLWWLRFLKPGFRHCYLLYRLDDGRTWLEINPMSNQVLVWFHIFEKPCNLASEIQGTVLKTRLGEAPAKCAPAAPFTCVEFVKRVLGIHQLTLITPYQLYKKLLIVGKKS